MLFLCILFMVSVVSIVSLNNYRTALFMLCILSVVSLNLCINHHELSL